MDEEEGHFELVMPFVMCQSQGGPYDDAAFVSGWRLGVLSEHLKLASIFPELEPGPISAPPGEEKQIDLLAMRYGFVMEVEEYDEDWSIYQFVRSSAE